MGFASCLSRSREGIVCVVRNPYDLELWWRDGGQANVRRHRKHELCSSDGEMESKWISEGIANMSYVKGLRLSKNVPRMFDTCKVTIITVFESCTEMESKWMSEGIANMSYVKGLRLFKNVPRMFGTCKVQIITVFESCTRCFCGKIQDRILLCGEFMPFWHGFIWILLNSSNKSACFLKRSFCL